MGAGDRRRIPASRVSALTGQPQCPRTRAALSAPTSKATKVFCRSSRTVLRRQGKATEGKRSQKMRYAYPTEL
ncbi:hypothetical protein GCM10025871_17070 [Deinococcus metallilatus]|nr:hypothetical protein GCM10025871_17070 [Deinococcus metallilatus]